MFSVWLHSWLYFNISIQWHSVADTSFCGSCEDSLMHRAAAAEMLYVLEPEKKLEAIKLIEESTNSLSLM